VTSHGEQITARVGPDANGPSGSPNSRPQRRGLIIRDADGRTTLHSREVTLRAGETRELKIEAKKE
jgi:hypothetical protein